MNRTPKDRAREVMIETLMIGDLGTAITNQEKRGQSELARRQLLPIQCPRAELETLGVKFGEPADDLFYNVELPQGWKIEATDHSMHSNLVDDKGRARGGIFYKAAFYDRSAHMHLNRRYSFNVAPITGWGDSYESGVTPFWGIVTDCGQIVWHTEETVGAKDWDGKDRVEKQAREYIDATYPDHASPMAYWDEE